MSGEILHSLSLHLGSYPDSMTLAEQRMRVVELLLEQEDGSLQEWNEILDFLFATGERFGSLSQVHIFLQGKMRRFRSELLDGVDATVEKVLP